VARRIAEGKIIANISEELRVTPCFFIVLCVITKSDNMTEKEFIALWVGRIKSKLKTFPNDFIKEIECDEISMPGKNLLIAPPLFGSHEIVDSDGNIIFQIDNHMKAKYIIYSNRNKPNKIFIPKSNEEIEKAIKEYEKHIDNFLKEIEKEFKTVFPNSKHFNSISTQIFNTLNIIRQ